VVYNTYKSIRLKKPTYDKLLKMKDEYESFDTLINRLLSKTMTIKGIFIEISDRDAEKMRSISKNWKVAYVHDIYDKELKRIVFARLEPKSTAPRLKSGACR